MNRENLYHKTVDILYQAYFNGTLRHGDCAACAVGNLITANCGYKIIKNEFNNCVWVDSHGKRVHIDWYDLVVGFGPSVEGIKQIQSSGYSVQESKRIERKFEGVMQFENDEEDMFNGLVAVLEVLKQIHEVTDEDLLTGNLTRFKQHYNKLQPTL